MENLLLKKLRIKPGYRIKVENAPEDVLEIFGDVPLDIVLDFEHRSDFEALIIFSTHLKELEAQIQHNLNQLKAETLFWIFYPKKSSQIASDLDLMQNWQNLASYGLSPCASAAVNETWTALRIKLASEVKASGMSNAHIKTNSYSEFIDPEQKQVKLPPDVELVLRKTPESLLFYDQLSYSNKKEYVLWIITAKQAKTREDRIKKTLEMLLARRKNPSQK